MGLKLALPPRGTNLNPAFYAPLGTHPLHFIILTLALMHIMPPNIDCLCIVLILVIAANWVRSRYFRVGGIPLMAWLQLAFMVLLCFSGVATNYDFHPDWF